MDPVGQYAEVNGLRLYFERHGGGRPLLLLHGAFGLASGWAPLLPGLIRSREVIAPEMQGHGHTADRDTPLTFEGMADDAAALVRQLGHNSVDVFGYSDGGTSAMALAIRHPSLVRRLAFIGAVAGPLAETYEPETRQQFLSIAPQTFNVPVLKEPYEAAAPDPSRWPVLVEKILGLGRDFGGFESDEIRAIQSPTLIMLGDAEGIRPEHMVDLWRMIPASQLAIFPRADHFMLFAQPQRLLGELLPFLDSE